MKKHIPLMKYPEHLRRKEGRGDKKMQDIRLDLNLIWHVYEDEISDPETFSVITQW